MDSMPPNRAAPHYRAVPHCPMGYVRAQPQRLRASDLTDWMASKGITRDMLEEWTRPPPLERDALMDPVCVAPPSAEYDGAVERAVERAAEEWMRPVSPGRLRRSDQRERNQGE